MTFYISLRAPKAHRASSLAVLFDIIFVLNSNYAFFFLIEIFTCTLCRTDMDSVQDSFGYLPQR